MAAAVLPVSNGQVSSSFAMSSHQHISSPSPLPAASSSRSKQPSLSQHVPAHDSTMKPFNRFRTTLEQSIRSATRSKKLPPPAADDFATVRNPTDYGKGKGKEKAVEERSSGMLRRLESKVNFRKSGRDSVTPSPSPIPPSTPARATKQDKVRLAGFTSFQTPSLRLASMSSPALHLSSQALPSPKSQSAIPASSSSGSDALVSPVRDKSRRASAQPSFNDPPPLTPKHESRGMHTSSSKEPTTRHRATKSAPIDIPTSQSVISLHTPPETPKRRHREQPSLPDTPTPLPGSRGQLTRNSSVRQAASSSASHLPLNTPPSPITPRGSSPIRARSPSTSRNRVVSPSHRGLTSSSTSHLPNTSPNPSPIPTRIDPQARRPSIDLPHRPTFSRDESPSPAPVRSRPTSPNQRSYAQNRHFNISTASLAPPSNPEHRELLRTATSMLCKEIVKPPPHMSRSEAGMRDWEDVEVRTRALCRLERIWGKSGISASSSNVNVGATSSSGLSAAGEERERKLFTEALRDGFVLCQLMNKLRASSVVRPDPREDGFVRTSNITKFLAACSSYGLPNEDLFQRDDLIEASGESLARVARTIIALIKYVDTPFIERSKFISGGKKSSAVGSSGGAPTAVSGPYKLGSISSRSGAASTPNLLSSQSHANSGSNANISNPHSLTPTPTRNHSKRWTPPSGLPPLRSDSSDEGSAYKGHDRGSGFESNTTHDAKFQRRDRPPEVYVDNDRQTREVPSVRTPPPRSPLRARSPRPSPNPPDDGRTLFTWAVKNPSRASAADSTRASIGDDSVRESISFSPDSHMRQSMASTAMTDITTTTTTTVVSSLMDVGRTNSAVFSKFGTIRTMTTEATSETPSITRTEGSSIADDLARKYRVSDVQYTRDGKVSDAPVVDLSRVVEETDESGSSSKGGGRDKGRRKATGQKGDLETDRVEKTPAIHLGKGKWPDDFIDALQTPPQPPSNPNSHASPEPEDRKHNSSSLLSSSPPRKLAIVGASRRNESVESLPQFPRKPTHRSRHSIDTPALLPKESVSGRDVSPEGLPSSRVMMRRHSTKPGVRNAVYMAKGNSDDPRGFDSDSLVPFPRTVSGELVVSGSNTPNNLSDDPSGSTPADNQPRQIRGRFQSDIEGSSRRRGRPNSYDELGVKPTRSRIGSMVNLGGASSNASASDLLNRDSMDGSRKPLIIKEDGKLPTHFQLGNCIGRGQFGTVYRALNLNTGQMVAVKRIRLEGLKEEEVTQLMREVDLVKRLSHPSIVKYEGMARDADTLSIVLEYAENGSLGQTLKAFGKLNERLVASYVVRILEGLHYLHQSDVVHCDLKAANILTTKNGNVKLSDFGVSLNMRAMEREIKDVAGTPNWMAPEVIELKGASPKSDIWSLACTVIELLTGRPPYGDIPNSMSVMFRIVEDEMPPIPPGVSPLLEDFLMKCFNKDPARRPSAELLCEHEWLKQNWGAHKELRPQDSIPFLRRVSADLQKSDAVRYLSQIEMPESTPEHPHRADDIVSGSPPGRRMSSSSMKPSMDDISPRGHSFVKTTFSKPMVCRVCLLNVKKSAVLCAQCSLISHSKCAVNAPPTCDLRAQLLLYAQYAEKGNPSSAYSNPVDVLNEIQPKSPMSDVPYVSHTPRTSLDTAPPPAAPSHSAPTQGAPPTAFKFIPFKRKGQSAESGPSSPSSSPPSENVIRKPTVLRKSNSGRPQSLGSNSTNANSSMRSAVTAASAGGKSIVSDTGVSFSAVGESDARASRVTSRSGVSEVSGDGRMPGDLSEESRRHRKTKSSSNCIVQ